MRACVLAGVVLVGALVGCGDDPPAVVIDAGWTVDDYCPGGEGCPQGGAAGDLRVGAAAASITPELVETEWDDANADGIWEKSEPYTDVNGNGEFDAYWLTNSNGRVATEVVGPLEVRALALERGDVSVAIVYLDTYLLFADDMDEIRAHPDVVALGLDHILIGSTHSHSAIDTAGNSGPTVTSSGVDPDYLQLVRDRSAQAITQAVQGMRPAHMSIVAFPTVDDTGSTLDFVSDTRDPIIYDPTVTVARFVDAASPDTTIGTLVNWASHPEYSGWDHNAASADYVHWLRAGIEDGLPDEAIPGIGGTVVFVQGALGGQVGPGQAHPIGPDGTPITERGFAKAQACGTNLARLVLEQLPGAEVVADPELSYRTATLWAELENIAFQTMFIIGVFDRWASYDDTQPVGEDNIPWLRSRETYLQIGPLAMITAPGELHPELFVGGYDGSWSWGLEILPEEVNRPDLSQAPQPPYLRDLMLENPGVEYPIVAGLAEDSVGYIVASFNYVLNEDNPWFEEAPGEHYEETYSIGPRVEERLQHPMMELARWRAPAP